MTKSTSKSNKPVYQVKLSKGISAAVFQNTREGRTYRSANIQRSYYKDGSWHRDGIYLNHDQIPFMIDALQRTWAYLNEFHPQSPTTATDEQAGTEARADETESSQQAESAAA